MTQWGVDALFNPGKRHMDEEKRRLQSTRAEVGDNSGGKRIDLGSGKVRIRRAAAQNLEQTAEDRTAEIDQTDDTDDTDEPVQAAGGRTGVDQTAEPGEPAGGARA